MGSRLNVAVIGCGWAGEQHVRAYTTVREARVSVVVDIDERKAKTLAEKWGIKAWYTDYRRVIEDPEIDAVSICLPHYLHSKVSVEAAEAGKHVLCEKPMANSLEEADAMISASEKAGVTLMIAENVRFHPINIKVRELVEQGYVGEVFLARIFRDHEMHDYLRERPWFLDLEKSGGGIWMAGGVHDVDALRMIVGEIEKVSLFKAEKAFSEMEGEDTIAAILRFENGAVGVITESFSTKTFREVSPSGCPWIVNGTHGTITTFQGELEVYSEKMGGPRSCIRVKVDEKDTFTEEIKHFLSCVKGGKKPLTSGEEERRTLAVILAGYKSLKRGGVTVEVEY
ncbi:Gfo/Idh/MocA family oxidoreductase [Candidatus Bathyarchaeota archaeon]|nr:Gfo/Idh/MocA family oxidoreductase [Candidatus Bathyarchaeota archaeon]